MMDADSDRANQFSNANTVTSFKGTLKTIIKSSKLFIFLVGLAFDFSKVQAAILCLPTE